MDSARRRLPGPSARFGTSLKSAEPSRPPSDHGRRARSKHRPLHMCDPEDPRPAGSALGEDCRSAGPRATSHLVAFGATLRTTPITAGGSGTLGRASVAAFIWLAARTLAWSRPGSCRPVAAGLRSSPLPLLKSLSVLELPIVATFNVTPTFNLASLAALNMAAVLDLPSLAMLATVVPPVPTNSAAPSETSVPAIPAPIPPGTMPPVTIPAVAMSFPEELNRL